MPNDFARAADAEASDLARMRELTSTEEILQAGFRGVIYTLFAIAEACDD